MLTKSGVVLTVGQLNLILINIVEPGNNLKFALCDSKVGWYYNNKSNCRDTHSFKCLKEWIILGLVPFQDLVFRLPLTRQGEITIIANWRNTIIIWFETHTTMITSVIQQCHHRPANSLYLKSDVYLLPFHFLCVEREFFLWPNNLLSYICGRVTLSLPVQLRKYVTREE